ncbi:MAG TPA: hypothetical protein VF498_13780, partial [Anaerolineales bacterium]
MSYIHEIPDEQATDLALEDDREAVARLAFSEEDRIFGELARMEDLIQFAHLFRRQRRSSMVPAAMRRPWLMMP